MELKVKFLHPHLADGIYQLRAPGCAAALLFWADEKGALDNWTAFAGIPVDACGKGVFRFQGGRAVPPEATHIYVRAVSDDLMHYEEKIFPIPDIQRTLPIGEGKRFSVMSDLHLSSKTGLVRHAFAGVQDAKALLLAGDMTNDGTSVQYELLKECIQEVGPHTKVYPVTGNHDMPVKPTKNSLGHSDYLMFQNWVFDRMGAHPAEDKEPSGGDIHHYIQGPDGAYAFRMGTVEIIGLQAVTDHRKFLFEEGRQLEWLDRHLSMSQDIRWHLILCHAPLLRHNPKREAGKNNPYLNRDKQLQEIIDRHGRIIFLSGHTHLSMDHPDGCVEWDVEHGNLYVNDGSVRPTDLLPGELMQPREWKEGTRLEMTICDEEVEIRTCSVKDGKSHARGYYRFYGLSGKMMT